MKTAEEIKREYGIDPKRLEEWEAEATKGNLPGTPRGEVINGRPPLHGVAMKPVVFKETEQRITDIDQRAESLGISRSEYLRHLIEKDLATA